MLTQMSAAVYPASLFRKHSLVNLKSNEVLSTPARAPRKIGRSSDLTPVPMPVDPDMQDRMLVAPLAEYFLLYRPFNDHRLSESQASDR